MRGDREEERIARARLGFQDLPDFTLRTCLYIYSVPVREKSTESIPHAARVHTRARSTD